MVVGLFLICLGGLFLLQNLGYISGGIGGLILPLIFIAIGLSMVLKGFSRREPKT